MFDIFAMVPHIPGNVEELKNELLDPFFSSVLMIKPGVVCLLNSLPLVGDMSK